MQFDLRILAGVIALASHAIPAIAAADGQTQPRGVTCTSIATAAQLHAMRQNLAGSYCLANDIDAGTIANFKPVGTAANPFTGSLRGNHHVVKNLTVDSAFPHVGLFGVTDGAVIQDLTLANMNVNGPDDAYIGGLVGSAYATSQPSAITRVSVSGVVRSSGSVSVGGIAGQLTENVTLKQSRSAADVFGLGENSVVGGLVAENRGRIHQSYTTGTSSGRRDSVVGGVAGYNHPEGSVRRSYAAGQIRTGALSLAGGLIGGNKGEVLLCYAAAPVTGGDAIAGGGLVGQQDGGTIIESYAVGPVSGGPGSGLGGLIGELSEPPLVMNAYWDTLTSGQTTSAGGLGGGLLTSQFREEMPPGFGAAWALTAPLSYPYLNDRNIDFASPLATLVQSNRVFVVVPVDQFDPAQYLTTPAHADDASLAAVYTMIARAVGVTNKDGRLKAVKIDRYFWKDATQTTTWQGPVTTYVTLGALTDIPAGSSLNATNVIGRMNNGRHVILRGAYRKSDGTVATHWMLGTLYTTADDASVATVVANDPASGSQIKINPNTKRVLTPDFPLSNFRVDGYQPVRIN